MPLHHHEDAWTIAERYIGTIENLCEETHIAGSLRRKAIRTTDIDLVVMPTRTDYLWSELDHQVDLGIIQKGDKWGNLFRNFIYNGVKVELYTCDPDNRGYKLWLRTGPGDAGKFLMSKLKQHESTVRFAGGYAWHVTYDSLHRNYDRYTGYAKLARLKVPDERAFFHLIGLHYIPPAARHNISYGTLNRSVDNPPVSVLKKNYYIEQPEDPKQPRLF